MAGKIIAETFFKVATGSRRLRTLLTPVGVLVFFCFLALLIFLSLKTDALFKFPHFISKPFNYVVSVSFICIGLFFVLWSVIHFVRSRGTPVPFNPPPKLVTTGPYAYVRNPMLSGVFISLFGLGFLLRSISLAFIFTPLLVLFNLLELKTVEEPELEKRLGKEYREYKQKTPMFIPRRK